MSPDVPGHSVDGPSQRTPALATGLLLGMAGLFAAALVWESQYPSLIWVRAFAEAAMVGALADWYAVTVLFRRPLGLPIPHTEIIPRNKERIAFRLGGLTQRQLLTPDTIGKLIESWRIPEEVTGMLLERERRQVLTQEASRLLARMVEASEDAAMQQFVRDVATKMVRGVHVAPLLGQLLSGFLRSSQRDPLLNDLLTLAHEFVERHRDELCGAIADKLPWSRFLTLVRLDEKVAHKIVDWFVSVLQEIRDRPDDPLRQQLIDRLEAAAQWLMHAELAMQRETALKEKLLSYQALLEFLDESWRNLKRWALADLQSEESEIRAYLDAALAGLGDTLRTDHEFVALVQRGLQESVLDLATRHRDKIGELVTSAVRNWSVVHMVDTIEREIGTDLQFIRINGTLVGGLVGLLLHAMALLVDKMK